MGFASLANIGSFASGLGSLASGLGIGSKGGSWKDLYGNMEAQAWGQRRMYEAQAYGINEVSKRTGLHPLSVVGSTPVNAPAAVVKSPDRGVDFEQIGQGVDRALNAGRTSVQRKLDELALEKAKLSNDYLRTQIAGAQAALSSSSSTIPLGSKNLSGVASDRLSLRPSDLIDVIKDQQTAKSPNDTGRTAGKHASFKKYDLGHGMSVEAPINEEGWAEAIGELPFWYKHPKMFEVLLKRLYGRSGLADKNRGKSWYKKSFPSPLDFFGYNKKYRK